MELSPRNPHRSRQTTTSLQSEVFTSTLHHFDARMVARVRDLVYAVVRAPHLLQERDDCVQQALVRLWQAVNEKPSQSFNWHLVHCRFFIRDRLKHGKSLDSPKRRALGRSIDSPGGALAYQSLMELVSQTDPAQQESARDALEQMCVRLNSREQTVLLLFLEGNGTREVARRLNICASVVSDTSRRIRTVALRLGLRPKNGDLLKENKKYEN